MLRKKDKLPADVHSIDFELKYDTAEAAAKLIEISGGKVAASIFVINLFDLDGSKSLVNKGYKS